MTGTGRRVACLRQERRGGHAITVAGLRPWHR